MSAQTTGQVMDYGITADGATRRAVAIGACAALTAAAALAVSRRTH